MDSNYLRHKNFDLCCRTCLKDDSKEMYDIFKETEDCINIAETLVLYLTIQVQEDCNLPKKLCSNCYQSILNFDQFRKQALHINTQLYQFLQTNNNKTYEVKIEDITSNPFEDYDDKIGYISDSECTVNTETGNCIETVETYIQNINKDGTALSESYDQIFTCDTCQKSFKNKSLLQHHKSKHKTDKYSCRLCPETFRHQYKYVKHLVQHGQSSSVQENDNISQSFSCEICQKTYKSKHALSAHTKKHISKDRILKCSSCNKTCKKLSHLKRHELVHRKLYPFKCQICPKMFTNENMLTEHVNTHNGVKPHACPVCLKAFSHMSTLTSHLKVHTRDKPYLCTTCGKQFDSKTNLNQHVKRHLGQKTFACELCPKTFVSKGELKSHASTHTGERPYICDQCPARFTKCSSLSKHKLRHLGVKPFQCETCSVRFTSKDHLKRHQRIHTGERPYRCEICERTFTQTNDLAKHRRSHLGNNIYPCNQCSQTFRLKTELSQHISEHFISSQLKQLKVTNHEQNNPSREMNVPQNVCSFKENVLNENSL